MMRSLQYIDYSREAFVKESMLAMYYSKGGLDQKSLEKMPFDIFEMYVNEALRIQKLNEKEEGGDIKNE